MGLNEKELYLKIFDEHRDDIMEEVRTLEKLSYEESNCFGFGCVYKVYLVKEGGWYVSEKIGHNTTSSGCYDGDEIEVLSIDASNDVDSIVDNEELEDYIHAAEEIGIDMQEDLFKWIDEYLEQECLEIKDFEDSFEIADVETYPWELREYLMGKVRYEYTEVYSHYLDIIVGYYLDNIIGTYENEILGNIERFA